VKEEDYIKTSEAAKILGLSRSHAYRLYRRLDAEASGEREEPGSSAQRRA